MGESNQPFLGLLIIGDPHLEGRTPGFRKDDYPRIILDKLEWALAYAREHQLLPALLGDLFDKPRDNPNWMLARLMDLLRDSHTLCLYGNHDCADPQLSDHDSLSLLVKSGRLHLLDDARWEGTINGRRVIVGGSSYRKAIPQCLDCEPIDPRPIGIWLTHHDILIPGYEEHGRIKPREIPGIDLIINGHIHRKLDDVQIGVTLWTTPGNISRRSRNDAVRTHVPSVLRIDITRDGYERKVVPIPHAKFEEIFHEEILEQPVESQASAFVAGLSELQARRTQSGAGLISFLEQNSSQFESAVAREILSLAKEVTKNA